MTEDVGEHLLPKFTKKAEAMKVNMEIVPNGSIEQLKELVALVASGEVSTYNFFFVLVKGYICCSLCHCVYVSTLQCVIEMTVTITRLDKVIYQKHQLPIKYNKCICNRDYN